MNYFKSLILALAAAMLMAGCSSSGGGAPKATITKDNAKDLAVAATEATKSASKSNSLSPFKTASGTEFNTKSFSKQIMQQAFATDPEFTICSSGASSFVVDVTPGSTTGSGSMVFVDCVVSDAFSTVTINGSIEMSATSSSATLNADLTISEGDIVETVTFTGTCSFNNSVIGACSFSSSFVGIDGRTYTSSNISISGDSSSGFSFSGNVTDPDFGVVTISTSTPVLLNCANGNPGSGEIVVSGNGSATVTFNDCDSFTVTYNDDNPINYNWTDI